MNRKKVLQEFLTKRILVAASNWRASFDEMFEYRKKECPDWLNDKEVILNDYNRYKNAFDKILCDVYDLHELEDCHCCESIDDESDNSLKP